MVKPNAIFPIEVTDAGIVIFVNELHPENTNSPIIVTDYGITILFKDVHWENVLYYISIIEFDNLTFYKLEDK